MKCPVCSVDLLLTERQGIELDYCPKCRGLWLDRGELDKILERSDVGQPQHSRKQYREADLSQTAPVNHHDYHKPQQHPKQKRKSFLRDIFDFD